MKPELRIVCDDCAAVGVLMGKYDVTVISPAPRPLAVPPGDDDVALLVCPPVTTAGPPNAFTPYTYDYCEDCTCPVYRARSSDWLLERSGRRL